MRNIGADVAVGDWVVPPATGNGSSTCSSAARRSCVGRRSRVPGRRPHRRRQHRRRVPVPLVRRRAEPAPSRARARAGVRQRCRPVVLLTKADLVDDPEPARRELQEVALGVPVLVSSGRTPNGLDELRRPAWCRAAPSPSSAPAVSASRRSSTRCSASSARRPRRCAATTAAGTPPWRPSCCAVPDDGGWLIDTPGIRALSLWLSGQGIERAFVDVFELMDQCRFRDCKHDREPGCAVRLAIEEGRLDPDRFDNLERLVAEEAALEEEQRANSGSPTAAAGHRPRRPSPTDPSVRRWSSAAGPDG